MPLLLALPLVLRKTTAAQDKLSPIYRIPLPARREIERPKPTISWDAPIAAWKDSLKQACRQLIFMGIRTFAFTGLMLSAIHRWLGPRLPQDIPWIKVGALLWGFVGLWSLGLITPCLADGNSQPQAADVWDLF